MLSFIVPAYNEEFELPRTLAAIRAAAESAKQEYEIIVVDDASTDATAQIARQSGAHLVQIQRRQIAGARNAGAKAARGDVLFFVDADTRINQKHIDGAIAALTAGCSGGSARVAIEEMVPWWGRFFLKVFCTIYFANNLGAGAFLFTTRRNFENAGCFNERYFAGEEVLLSLALKKLGRFRILREPVITSGRKLRMHSGRHLWWQSVRLMLGGMAAYRSRKKLGLWYDGKRETHST
jgi:glycosyltransferase involved in cell wall biosynthesis